MSQHDTLTLEPTRAAFERYFLESRKSKGANRKPTFERFEDGTYKDDHTQRHWWTWQNALSATQPAQAAQSEPDYSGMSREALERHAKRMSQMLADDRAREFYDKHANGPMMMPSCLCCGRLPGKVAIKHLELPGIVICEECHTKATAQAAQGAGEAVASIYITPEGAREVDDWKHDLPVGRNILYTHPTPAQPAPVVPEPVAASRPTFEIDLGDNDPRTAHVVWSDWDHAANKVILCVSVRDHQQAPVAWRMRDTGFRNPTYVYFTTKEQADSHAAHILQSRDDGHLTELTPLYASLTPPAQAAADARDAQPMIPLSMLRPIAVEAIRAITGCPDLSSGDRHLTDEIEAVAIAALATHQQGARE